MFFLVDILEKKQFLNLKKSKVLKGNNILFFQVFVDLKGEPIPSLMDIDFNRFLYTRMAGLMVAMVAMVVMVVMVVTAGRSVTVETGMEVLQSPTSQLGRKMWWKVWARFERGFAGSKS